MDPAAADIARARDTRMERDAESIEDQLAEDRAQLEADQPDELDADQPDAELVRLDREEVAEKIRGHKRQIRHHREKTRALARHLEQLDAELAAFGITLEINTQPDQGGHSGSINGGEAETL